MHAAPSFAPYGFGYTSLTDTSIRLAWEPPPLDDRSSGTISHYKLKICPLSKWLPCSMVQTTSLHAETQLDPGQEYTLSIVACTTDGCGSRESSFRITLPQTGVYSICASC